MQKQKGGQRREGRNEEGSPEGNLEVSKKPKGFWVEKGSALCLADRRALAQPLQVGQSRDSSLTPWRAAAVTVAKTKWDEQVLTRAKAAGSL